MKNYTGGVMDTSTKYSVAHMYSSRRPQEWESRMAGEGWIKDYKAWLNLRNDDLFMHRFGSPDYASGDGSQKGSHCGSQKRGQVVG
jgi:hypothetical protein